MKKIITFLFLIIVAGFFFYIQYSPSHKQSLISQVASSTVPRTLNSQINITSKTINQSEKPDPNISYDIKATYPQINGLKDVAVQNKINQNLKDLVDQDIAKFKSDYSPDAISTPYYKGPFQNTFSLDYSTSTPLNFGNIVSIVLSQELYSAPSAHPVHQVDSFTFDLTTGEILSLDDYFTGSYLQAFSDYASSSLPAILGDYTDAEMIKEGTAPTADNFKVFLPKNDGLHIIFNEYQVAPYVVGQPEIVVPWSVLKPFLLNKNLI